MGPHGRRFCRKHPRTRPVPTRASGKRRAWLICPKCREGQLRAARDIRVEKRLDAESWEQYLERRPQKRAVDERPSDLAVAYYADAFPRGALSLRAA